MSAAIVGDRVTYDVRFEKLNNQGAVVKTVSVKSKKFIPIPPLKQQIAIDAIDGGEVNGVVENIEFTGGVTGSVSAGTYSSLIVVQVK